MTTSIGKQIFFVVGTSEESGKTLVAEYLMRRFGVPTVSSSVVIEPRVDVLLGKPVGTVAEARKMWRDAYRQDLVDEGDRMRAAGHPPGVVCVRKGYRIIDGLRTGPELAASIDYARSIGLDPFVFCVDRHGRPPIDNTDVAGLSALADTMIHNDWEDNKPALFAVVETALTTKRNGSRRDK